MEAIFQTVAYTDILHLCGTSLRFKVYTSLEQGTCVLYCGPKVQVNGLCVQNLVVAGQVWQVVAQHRNFSVHAWNFGHKDQMVFDHRDCK